MAAVAVILAFACYTATKAQVRAARESPAIQAANRALWTLAAILFSLLLF